MNTYNKSTHREVPLQFKPLPNVDELPHIKKFEREPEVKKQFAPIYTSFRINSSNEKSSFVKSQEKSFMNQSIRSKKSNT